VASSRKIVKGRTESGTGAKKGKQKPKFWKVLDPIRTRRKKGAHLGEATLVILKGKRKRGVMLLRA